ncbi:MAG: hypothetical protein ACTSXX_14960 [Candidatus Baldrarchaeia archaeon]
MSEVCTPVYGVYRPEVLLREERFARIECADIAGDQIFLGVSGPNGLISVDIRSGEVQKVREEDEAISKLAAKRVDGYIYVAYITTGLKLVVLEISPPNEIINEKLIRLSDVLPEREMPDEIKIFRFKDSIYLLLVSFGKRYFTLIDVKRALSRLVEDFREIVIVNVQTSIINVYCIDNQGFAISSDSGRHFIIYGDLLVERIKSLEYEIKPDKDLMVPVDDSPLTSRWEKVSRKLGYLTSPKPKLHKLIYVPDNFSGALVSFIIDSKYVVAWFKAKRQRPLELSEDAMHITEGEVISLHNRGIESVLLLQREQAVLIDVSGEIPAMRVIDLVSIGIKEGIAAFYVDGGLYVVTRENIFRVDPYLYDEICKLELSLSKTINELYGVRDLSVIVDKVILVSSLALQLDLLNILRERDPNEISRIVKDVGIKEKDIKNIIDKLVKKEDREEVFGKEKKVLEDILELPKKILRTMRESPENLSKVAIEMGRFLTSILSVSLSPVVFMGLSAANFLIWPIVRKIRKEE